VSFQSRQKKRKYKAVYSVRFAARGIEGVPGLDPVRAQEPGAQSHMNQGVYRVSLTAARYPGRREREAGRPRARPGPGSRDL
jgi:hypothetical protein